MRAPVLERVARAIHQHSVRRKRPFVAVNCGALVETLLESELFGHVRGAFSGAVSIRQGRFEIANGSTIFLDEVAEFASATQVKLCACYKKANSKRSVRPRPKT